MVLAALEGIATWSRLKGASEDDWVDRLNHIYTVLILGMFVLVTSTSQYVGDPIICWCPAQFTDTYVRYTQQICWVSNTYYLSFDDQISRQRDERWNNEITYYQWIPLILAFMAFLFKVPHVTWRVFNGVSGINLDNVVTLAESTQMLPVHERNDVILRIAYFIDRWIDTHRDYKENMFVRVRRKCRFLFWCVGGNREGTYLTGFYLLCKLLYCINCVGQFFLLNAFMDTPFSMFGIDIIKQLILTGEWKESVRFPRVTLCDFHIRQLQNVQQFTVQCVLPINLFNEKIFAFIWFWLVLVSIITIGSLIVWMYRLFFQTSNVGYIKKYLLVADEIHSGFRRNMLNKFAQKYLRSDGIFLLRLVEKHSSDMAIRDLIVELWKISKETPGFRKPETEHFGLEEADDVDESIHLNSWA